MKIAILGAGTAGLIAALSLNKYLPGASISVVHDPTLSTIGVGEGTVPNFAQFIFHTLGIKRSDFYQYVRPTWKLGIRYDWGSRDHFFYTFDNIFDGRLGQDVLPVGFFCDEDCGGLSLSDALADNGLVFPRRKDGIPVITEGSHAFHVENSELIRFLRHTAEKRGILFVEANSLAPKIGEKGVVELRLHDGTKISADLFIDASGFKAELLGKALQEPFESFSTLLFCNKAVVGGWQRTTEIIQPYTQSEQMSAGWCWKIEHEKRVNRGYVFSTDHINEEEATREFLQANPKCKNARIVDFKSGCRTRFWVKNVVGIGNAAGFVEPLEATAIWATIIQANYLGELISQCGYTTKASMRMIYNKAIQDVWFEIRDFLALHYKANLSGGSPFWDRCLHELSIPDLDEFLYAYRECGPTGFLRSLLPRDNLFGLNGYLAILIGSNAPHNGIEPEARQRQSFEAHRTRIKERAKNGLSVQESLQFVHHPRWIWFRDQEDGHMQSFKPD